METIDSLRYAHTSPAEVRKLIRAGKIDYFTSGMSQGYAQANLVILPKDLAYDFLLSSVVGLVIFVVLVIAAAIGIFFLLRLMKKLTEKERKKAEPQTASDDIYSDSFVALPALKKGFDKKTDVYLVIVTLLGAFATLFTLIWGFLR